MKNSVLTRVVSIPRRLAVFGLLAAGAMTIVLLAQAGSLVPFKGICIGERVLEGGVIANVSGNGTHIGQYTGILYYDLTVVLRAPDGIQLWAKITPKAAGGVLRKLLVEPDGSKMRLDIGSPPGIRHKEPPPDGLRPS